MTQSQPDSLFNEFPAVSRAEWKTKAVAELKEIPYDSIVWHTPDGFDLEPWYSHEEQALQLDVPPGKATNTWKNCRCITVHDPESANKAAIKSFEQDTAALEFRITDPSLCSAENLRKLFAGIETSAIAIYFSGNLPPAHELLETLLAIPGFATNTGGVLAGNAAASLGQELSGWKASLPEFRVLSVDILPYHEAGSTAAQDIALALSGASDLLHHFQEAGIEAESVVSAMEIIMAVGSSHFTELAKPRALRYLLQHLLKAYGASGASLPRLFARTSERNRSLLDPYTNVLRLTTEAVSAILGGYDTLQISAFDDGLSVTPDIAERITGNIHLILKEEGSLNRVLDPARGSHYIETLTRKLAESAWEIFREIEAAGGLSEATAKGIIEPMIAGSAAENHKNIGKRKKTLIGVNHYAIALGTEQEENISAIAAVAEKLPAGSETAAFELLRLKTLSFALKSGRTPSVFIWMHGDPAISFRQAAFSEDFFKCAGFEIAGSAALPLEEHSYSVALQNKPDIIVLCIAQKDPVPTAETITSTLCNLQPGIVPVMAGKPPKESERLINAGIDSFIYTGVNLLEMLSSFQLKTGVQ